MRTSIFFGAAALVAIAACKDPAKDAAKAQAGEAVTTTAKDAPSGAVDYAFDANGSTIGWTGSKVTGKHEGGFGKFSGVVHLVGGAPEKSSVNVDIDVGSIHADNEKLTGHLRSPDFFDAAKFTTATFVSTSVAKGGDKGATHTITGNLTMHGVTKSISFPAKVAVTGDKVDVDAQFAIDRKAFGINYPGKQDDLIRDDVVVRLAIHAKKSG